MCLTCYIIYQSNEKVEGERRNRNRSLHNFRASERPQELKLRARPEEAADLVGESTLGVDELEEVDAVDVDHVGALGRQHGVLQHRVGQAAEVAREFDRLNGNDGNQKGKLSYPRQQRRTTRFCLLRSQAGLGLLSGKICPIQPFRGQRINFLLVSISKTGKY